jgi:hypothetical protein
MKTTIVTIIVLAFMNTLAVLGIILLDGLFLYWSKLGIIKGNTRIVAPFLIAVLFFLNFVLLFANSISHYKWSLKKKVIAAVVIFLAFFPGFIILQFLFKGFMRIVDFLIGLIAR